MEVELIYHTTFSTAIDYCHTTDMIHILQIKGIILQVCGRQMEQMEKRSDMRSMFVLFRWECRRILSNWRQTIAIFLVPSIVLLLALYLFPVLVDYISTGNIGRAPIVLVSADEYVLSFIRTDPLAAGYSYKIWSANTYSAALTDGSAAGVTADGGIIVVFQSADEALFADSTSTYTDAINTHFQMISEGKENNHTSAVISIYSDPRIIMSQTTAYQFQENILPRYKDYLIKTAGRSFYSEGGGAPFTVDIFNPFTKLMEYRSVANPMGARVIPGILLLLLYYCVYALSGDILAADRDRGFLAKLTLTPLSTRGLLWGKGLAVAGVSSLTSLITLLVLLLSSWTNRSNNPLSLIPFGLLLTPSQLALIIGSVICAAVVMTMYCFKVILDLHNMQDIIMNLQLPLLLFLVDFFLQLFRTSTPVWVEYAIPWHNNLLLIHDIMAGTVYLPFYAVISVFDIIIAFFLYRNIKRTFEQESASRKTWFKFRRRIQ